MAHKSSLQRQVYEAILVGRYLDSIPNNKLKYTRFYLQKMRCILDKPQSERGKIKNIGENIPCVRNGDMVDRKRNAVVRKRNSRDQEC